MRAPAPVPAYRVKTAPLVAESITSFGNPWLALAAVALLMPALLFAGGASSSRPQRLLPAAQISASPLPAADASQARAWPSHAEDVSPLDDRRVRRDRKRANAEAAVLTRKMNAALLKPALAAHRGVDPMRWAATVIAAARAESVLLVDEHARQAAALEGLPVDLLRAVILVESRYNPSAISADGAAGLMQLMPKTALAMGVQDVFDARQNVFGGARLLRTLTDRFDGDPVRAIAAYNAGGSTVRRYDGVPPFPETRQYVARVLGAYHHYRTERASRLATERRDSSKPRRTPVLLTTDRASTSGSQG